MSEDSFIIPQFKPLDQSGVAFDSTDFFEPPTLVTQQRADRKLTYNHYGNCCKKVEIETESTAGFSYGGKDRSETLE